MHYAYLFKTTLTILSFFSHKTSEQTFRKHLSHERMIHSAYSLGNLNNDHDDIKQNTSLLTRPPSCHTSSEVNSCLLIVLSCSELRHSKYQLT